MMQVSKRIPFEDPQVLNTVRAVYIGSNVVIALIYAYILTQINKKKGMSTERQLHAACDDFFRHAMLLYTHTNVA